MGEDVILTGEKDRKREEDRIKRKSSLTPFLEELFLGSNVQLFISFYLIDYLTIHQCQHTFQNMDTVQNVQLPIMHIVKDKWQFPIY